MPTVGSTHVEACYMYHRIVVQSLMIIIPHVQMREPGYRDVRWLAQEHPSGNSSRLLIPAVWRYRLCCHLLAVLPCCTQYNGGSLLM